MIPKFFPRLIAIFALGAFLTTAYFQNTAPASAAPEAVLTVNLAGDFLPSTCTPQACLLREAILAANATPGVQETIRFNIPTNSANCNANTGVCTIKLIAPLPDITDPVIIDGYTQPGAHPNTLNVGNDAALKIVLDGSAIGNKNGLHVTGGNSTIKGLVVQNFSAAIFLESNANVVSGDFLGTDVTGNVAAGNWSGVWVIGANNRIGGTTPDARNLVSGNAMFGIYLQNATGTLIAGNYIGTNYQGLSALPNTIAIYLENSSTNTIGGTGVSARNILSGNTQVGIFLLYDTHDNLIKGNFIGLAADTTGALGNSWDGIWIWGDNQAFVRSNTITRNRIANNGRAGIKIGHAANDMSANNTLTRNAIYNNGKLGIDIFPENVNNPNDNGDGDYGPNHMQNYPELSKVTSANGTTTITGAFKSKPKQAYLIEIFTNKPCEDSGHGEGKKYLGAVKVTTNKNGVAKFTFSKNKTLAAGTAVTATATEFVNALPGSTSEFSACQGVQ